MIKLAFKGLFARKLRTVLTGFAVVLGVAFVAGTFVFTDTIDASFKDLFERTSKRVDAPGHRRRPKGRLRTPVEGRRRLRPVPPGGGGRLRRAAHHARGHARQGPRGSR